MRSFKTPLVVGDLAILAAFTAGGISFHQVEGSAVAEFVRIGWPFFTGYVVAALLSGAWRGVWGKELFVRGLSAWLVGIGLGVLLRIVETSRLPVPSFVLVTFLFTGLLFTLWRALYVGLARKFGRAD